MCKVKQNDTIMLYDREKDKKRIINLSSTKGRLSTENGFIDLNHLPNTKYGSIVTTQLGYPYTILPVNLIDFIIKKLRRLTQIVYPKDAAYILLKMDVKPGDTVIESGIGSGAMSCVFAQYVGTDGKVVSYEINDEFAQNAYSNIKKMGFDDRIVIKHRDIKDGFDETAVDSIFLDVKEPWLYINQAYRALKAGSMLCILVPTTNQIEKVIDEFNHFSLIDIEISELLLRKYKPVSQRLRPQDRMGAHTAYMIFARKI
jgi:tRNA (adenine57-N1/adenine58-N1)-methyltransferase